MNEPTTQAREDQLLNQALTNVARRKNADHLSGDAFGTSRSDFAGAKCTQPPLTIAERIAATDHALKVKELAALLSWSPSLVYTRARDGRMGAGVIRVGGTVRFEPVLTAQWLRDQTDVL
jgi:hypothetical protein